MDIGQCWRRLAPRRCCGVAHTSQGTDKVMKATPPLSLFDDGPGQVRSALLVGDQPHGDRCRAHAERMVGSAAGFDPCGVRAWGQLAPVRRTEVAQDDYQSGLA